MERQHQQKHQEEEDEKEEKSQIDTVSTGEAFSKETKTVQRIWMYMLDFGAFYVMAMN